MAIPISRQNRATGTQYPIESPVRRFTVIRRPSTSLSENNTAWRVINVFNSVIAGFSVFFVAKMNGNEKWDQFWSIYSPFGLGAIGFLTALFVTQVVSPRIHKKIIGGGWIS